MPSADSILSGLTAIANDWRTLAVLWHLYLAILIGALVAGWRPPTRVVARLLIPPLLSVGVVAWVSGNPFNGAVFTCLAAILTLVSRRASNTPVEAALPAGLAAGAVLVVFAWMYPHFLRADSWTAYAYASPLGLIPCPTLAAVTGLTLALGLHRVRTSPLDNTWPDPLLERFIPRYEVVERHHIRIDAPADVVLEAAREFALLQSPIIRAIFRARELLLGARPTSRPQAGTLLADMLSIGWRVLAEVPGREVVVGAATRPWEPVVTFRPVAPESFAAFAEPDYVKIVWTLRADPVGDGGSVFRTETRVVATDPTARAKFRRYWRFFSPGIIAIRWLLLRPLKAEAERRARYATEDTNAPRA